MLVKAGKFLATLFLIYLSWYYGAIGPDNTLLYGLAIGTTFFTALDLLLTNGNVQKGMSSLIPMFVAFGIYSLVSGLLFAEYPQYLGSSLVTYFAYTVVCFDICYISQKEKSAEWVLSGFVISAILCSVQTILWGKDYVNNGVTVLTMGPGNNPNDLGLALLFGIFGVVNSKNYKKHFYRDIILAVVFLYVIMLTGSRKCFLAGVVLMAIWVVMYIRSEIKTSGSGKSLGRILFLGAMVVAVLVYVSNHFEGTSMYTRLMDSIGNNQSDQNRIKMYQRAIELWQTNPFFGIGFNQYRLYVGTYSHATYAELLASGGVVGCMIWLMTFWRKTARELRCIKQSQGNVRYHVYLNLLMLAVELLMGVVQIWFYDYTHMLMLTYLFLYREIVDQQEGNKLEDRKDIVYGT